MIECQLLRVSSDDQGTDGLFSTPTRIYRSGELPWRNNQSDVSCVPDGAYIAKWIWSPHHNAYKYMLQDVPNRSACEIHSGNYHGDVNKGYKSDVLGCILLGTEVAEVPVGAITQRIVANSKEAIAAFEAEMAGQDFQLTIKCQQGLGPFAVAS